MTQRKDIETGRLIYTCNCGWVDLGHAGIELDSANTYSLKYKRKPSKAGRPWIGADVLWSQIDKEQGGRSVLDPRGYKVTYRQEMGWKGTYAGETRQYWVRTGLTRDQKEQVALAIFSEVSHAFEGMQGSWPYSWATDSGYSQEDLVSNLIGFYMVVHPKLLDRFEELCRPISLQGSLDIWDKYGAVGQTKNKNFTPIYRECDECTQLPAPAFPPEFQTIQPAAKSTVEKIKRGEGLFRNWMVDDDRSPVVRQGTLYERTTLP
jgi:hypothetical protein